MKLNQIKRFSWPSHPDCLRYKINYFLGIVGEPQFVKIHQKLTKCDWVFFQQCWSDSSDNNNSNVYIFPQFIRLTLLFSFWTLERSLSFSSLIKSINIINKKGINIYLRLPNQKRVNTGTLYHLFILDREIVIILRTFKHCRNRLIQLT